MTPPEIPPRPSADGRLNASALRPDLLAGPGTGEALADYGIVGFETYPDDAQTVHDRPELDAFDAHRAVVGDDVHNLARLIGCDRAVGHEQALVFAAEKPEPSEETGSQQSVLVGQNGTGAHRAGLRADGVVHEFHAAFVLEISLVRQPHRDRIGRVA